jgi:glycosyltransferase involved in cell wall biosynthesis
MRLDRRLVPPLRRHGGVKPTRPWHVAHVIGALGIGGAERQLVNYLLAADRADFRHTAICLTEKGSLAATVRDAGVPVVVMRVRLRTLWRDLPRLAAWLRRNDVALVHAHMFSAALWGRLAAMGAGVPARVLTEHGRQLWKNRLQIGLDRLLTRHTCRHIAVSADGLRLRLAREKVAPDRIVLIPNGVAMPSLADGEARRRRVRAELGLTDDQPVVGTVGRVVPVKGYTHLLAALAVLRARFPAVRWLLVGDGPDLPVLLAEADRTGMRDALLAVGVRSDITDLLAAMDVFVMSSVREGLPVALLEAMAAARPVVVTDVGGMPEAVTHDRDGLVVPVADPAALAEAIGGLLADPDAAARLAAAARATAEERYAITSVARRIEDVYRQCLGAR